jgi:hypothetical protein
MKSMIVAALLLTMPWAVSPAQHKLQLKGPLSLTISPQLTKYVEGGPLPVRLTFKNIGKKRTSFILPDKDEDPPGFIQARVWDAQGKLLTENDTLQAGWWTVQVLSSSFYKEKKSDRISLKPSEEFTRAVDLKRLLWGCRGLPEGLRVGQYRVQFSLGDVASNEVEIIVAKSNE